MTDLRSDTRHCSKCETDRPVVEFNICRSRKDGLQYWCRHCNRAAYRAQRRAEPIPVWARTVCASARSRAARVGVPFALTTGLLLSLAVPVCPVFGTLLDYSGGTTRTSGPQDTSATLDRLVPSRGYTPGNVRVISMRANRLKSDASVEELEALLTYCVRELHQQ